MTSQLFRLRLQLMCFQWKSRKTLYCTADSAGNEASVRNTTKVFASSTSKVNSLNWRLEICSPNVSTVAVFYVELKHIHIWSAVIQFKSEALFSSQNKVQLHQLKLILLKWSFQICSPNVSSCFLRRVRANSHLKCCNFNPIWSAIFSHKKQSFINESTFY